MRDFAAARRVMVDNQVRPADVTSHAIIDAMLWAPRERFVPKARRDVAYADIEIPLGPGRVLLQPRTFAKMLEAASIDPHDLVLDLAPGTGYSTAVIASMAEAVVAIEPDAGLTRQAQALLVELEVDNAVVSQGDPAAGDPAHGPYDVMFVNGAVELLPEALVGQLKQGGRLVAIFRDGGSGGAGGTSEGAVGKCRVLTRAGNGVSRLYVFDADAPVLPGFERPVAFAF
ncbi:MAG TPA: protein-L-isoaspartate O-methyltransferase [Thermohalobaculum sp.]|nr:protein-L-isoaspartate O-methyltransferase [Thermohalobaculum sp.]